jgi:2-C-methyl-D-erythritol 4-phosphate cytidylyltransferase
MATFSVVIVTAAPPGLGNETGGAFVKIDGREALLRSVELFLNRENVKQIQLVVSQDAAEEAKRKYGAHLGFSGVKLVTAGAKWSEHLAAAAEKMSPEATHVIVHDAARPAVPYNDLDALLDAAEKHAAVALAAPVRSSILELDEADLPVGQHLPNRFVQLQTPQAMTRAKFVESAKAQKELHASEWTLIKGSILNVRLGSPGDERLVKAMIGLLPKPKIKAADNPFGEAQW